MNTATLLTLALLVIILWWMTLEDVRYRAVSLWTYPVLFIGLLLSSVYTSTLEQTLWNIQGNLLIIVIQLTSLWLYLVIKHRAIVNPMQGFLGWGDVLFWLAIVPAFSPLLFLLFYIGSALAALLMHLLFRQYPWYGNTAKVPLAGMQALLYSGWLLVYGLTNSPSWLTQ